MSFRTKDQVGWHCPGTVEFPMSGVLDIKGGQLQLIEISLTIQYSVRRAGVRQFALKLEYTQDHDGSLGVDGRLGRGEDVVRWLRRAQGPPKRRYFREGVQ